MARIARVVFPGVPHHITQRGNRRQRVFFSDSDYSRYFDFMVEWCEKAEIEVWAYCFMPNHVHLIAVPKYEESLKKGIGEANRRYSCMINSRENWRGHLWQGRFASYPMDEKYLFYAARYIELNPVRAGLVKTPEDYKWSSVAAHLGGKNNSLVRVKPLLKSIPDWKEFLLEPLNDESTKMLQKHERTGRPLGNHGFIENLEKTSGLILLPKKPGPKRQK